MRYAYFTLAFLVVLTVSIMGFRGLRSTQPPIEVFPDMDRQAKYKPQGASKFFADGRADRPVPAGTVPRGRSTAADPAFLRADDFRYAGQAPGGAFARGFPVAVTEPMIRRGQDRYQIYCAPCHGALGDGNGITKSYGMVATPTYHDERLRAMAEGEIFHTISAGKNTMLSYVRALQRAHHATLGDVPPGQRGDLK